MNYAILSLPLSALLLTSCSTLPSTGQQAKPTSGSSFPLDSTPSLRVEAFHHSVELDGVKFDDPGFAETTLDDEDRRRSGVRASYGPGFVRGFVEVFHEDYLGADDGFGVSIGATGEIPLYRFENECEIFATYGVGGTFVDGGDLTVSGATGDYSYFEGSFESGVGVQYRGLRPSIGFTTKSQVGNVDFVGEGDQDFGDDDFKADVASGYLELAYRPEATGFAASVRGLLGQETGAYFTLGWGF